MHIDIITIFPEMFSALDYGIVGRAIKQGLITINYINPRSYSTKHYGNVDDSPFGGGPGMVMMVEPLRAAIHAAKAASSLSPQQPSLLPSISALAAPSQAHVMYLSPQGKLFDQRAAEQLAARQHLVMLAGRYEGVDERLIELEVDSELSIGDYVLSGGEFAAMVVIDAITRLLPHALGDVSSAQQDSFTSGLLDYPHYTKPRFIFGKGVPQVLCSGDHRAIARWRLKQALGRTWLRRPDLLRQRQLTSEETELLYEFLRESEKQE